MSIPYGREYPEPEWPDGPPDEGGLNEPGSIKPAPSVGQRHPVLDWSRVFEGAPEDVQWLVPDVIARGRAYSIVATAKAGKSLLMLDIAASLSTGRPVLGNRKRKPERVLYVDLENSQDDIADRLRDMDYRPEQLENLRYLSFPTLPTLDSEAGGRELAELAELHDAALVIIDTLSRVVRGDENSADTYRNLYRYALAPLKSQRRAVVRLDHTGKDGAAGARGSSAKNDDVDAVWLLSQQVEKGGLARVGLKLERQRGNAHPERVKILREVDPILRHVAIEDEPPLGDQLRIQETVAEMNRLKLDPEIGGMKARKALRAAGLKVRNDIVAAAVKARKKAAEGVEDRPIPELAAF